VASIHHWQFCERLHQSPAEDAVAVAQQISRRAVPRKRLPELLSRPFRSRMRRDSEMQNSAAVMRQHQKYVQDLKPNCWYRKEVNRYEILDVIVEEGFPGLGCGFGLRTKYLLTLVSPISVPSFRSSP
jgi:hypothetical protein